MRAQDGATILIPNGTATWTGGISTSKQIRIRAQNITPAPAGTAGAGTMSRNVTLTNGTPLGSGTALFQFTSGNSHHVGVAGIRFNEQTMSNSSTERGPHIRSHGHRDQGAAYPRLRVSMHAAQRLLNRYRDHRGVAAAAA